MDDTTRGEGIWAAGGTQFISRMVDFTGMVRPGSITQQVMAMVADLKTVPVQLKMICVLCEM